MRNGPLLWLVASAAASPLLQLSRRMPANYPGLRFGADGKFSISVFSDLHLGEPTWVGPGKGPDADLKTIGVMNSVLDKEQPNLVVLNGDMISCEFVSSEDALRLTDQIAAPLVDRNLPFAATFGNHDMSKTCNTRTVSEHMWSSIKGKNEQKLSFTTLSIPGPYNEVGTSNYFVPIYASGGGGDPQIAMLLYFFDSKGGRDFQKVDSNGNDVSVPKRVDDKVLSWFQSTRDTIHQQQGRVVPSLAFVHIPLHATRAMQDNFDSATAPGLNEENINHEGDVCDNNNNCHYAETDVPFMQALTETEGLMAVFSGHDHRIDWCAKWSKDLPNNSPANGNGLNLCFNRHTGYGGYSNWARGGRQIMVEEGRLGDKTVETWIRLEDGSISGRVTLNSTFGTDQYPPVKKYTSTGL